MLKKTLVSIIIPCKNVDDYTRECIEYCKRLDNAAFEILLLPDYVTEVIEGGKNHRDWPSASRN